MLIDHFFISLYLAPYVDDTLDVFSVHGVAGTVGVVLTGVFGTDSINGICGSLWVQVVAIVLVMPYVCVMTYLVCWISDSIVPLRISEIAELVGLDSSYHGINLYSGLDNSNHSVSLSKYGSDLDNSIHEPEKSKGSSLYQTAENSDVELYLNPKKFTREFSFSDLKEAGKRIDAQTKERLKEKQRDRKNSALHAATSPITIARKSLSSKIDNNGASNFMDMEALSCKNSSSPESVNLHGSNYIEQIDMIAESDDL